MAENLDALKCGGWGVFIAPTTNMALVKASVVWRTGQSGAPATSPGHWVPTVGASDNGATGQSGGAPDSQCSLSGAPSDAYSDFCARRRAL
jgi:hypothetical protein